MAGTTPFALAVHPLAKSLYAAGAGSNNVSGYSINPTTGALTALANSPFAAGTKPSSAAVDYSGMFLYVTNSGDDTVSIFNIDLSTGVLSAVPAPAAPTGSTPKSVTTTGTIH
jgi:6-phosphogluconolactonase